MKKFVLVILIFCLIIAFLFFVPLAIGCFISVISNLFLHTDFLDFKHTYELGVLAFSIVVGVAGLIFLSYMIVERCFYER